ncbi:MAG: MFS transporter [Cyclobacteriaceae bacterium]
MKKVLAIIVISQFFCTSLWFAGNAILPDIITTLHLDHTFLAHLTSAVQFGFITGTLVFALFTISDRFSPSWVFFISALVAALCNLAVSLENIPPSGLLCFRFLTGFFLAGIYPVGMKIASDYYQKGLGKSLGFFGHMWELYTFWAFVPVMLTAYKNHQNSTLNVALYSFLIIAAGGGACVLSGLLSQSFKPKNLATLALFLSGLCCLFSPLFLLQSSVLVFLAFLFFWGLVVIADSPLFSTLVAQYAPEESRGTSLTIVNCIGFAITIVSIQSIGALSTYIHERYIYLLLAIGPIFGLGALLRGEESPLELNLNRTHTRN